MYVIIWLGDVIVNNKIDTIKNVIIVILVLVIVGGGMFLVPTDSSKNKDTGVSDSNNIEELAIEESNNILDNEKKTLNEVTLSQYLDLYNGTTDSIVLIARPTCYYCQIAEPIIQNVAYKYDLTINYLNTDNLNEEDQASLIKSDDYFESFGTPVILIVGDGKIKNKLEGLTISDYYISFFKETGFIVEK